MTDAAYPIPNDFREAFAQAVADFDGWGQGVDEPQILLDREPYTISAICNFVEQFLDRAPAEIFEAVCTLAQNAERSPERPSGNFVVPKDNTYKSLAQCLHQLHIARKDWYRRNSQSP